MARVLLIVLAFAVLYGCDQASSPVEKQEKQGASRRPRRTKRASRRPKGRLAKNKRGTYPPTTSRLTEAARRAVYRAGASWSPPTPLPERTSEPSPSTCATRTRRPRR